MYINKLNMKSFTIIILLFFALSCKKKEPVVDYDGLEACGVSDPIHNLKWLHAEFELLEGGPEMNGIVLYTYEGREVIEVQNSVSSSINIHQYYCDGTKLDLENPDNFKKFKSERVEIGMLYGTKIWKTATRPK